MVRNRLFQHAWGLGVPLLLAGCDPTISEFDVQPRRACAGDTVQITWRVRGTPQVVAVRRTEDSVDLIRYTLLVESGGKQATRALDVITYTPGVPVTLSAPTVMRGRDSLGARDSIPPSIWHSLVRVGEVGSDSSRTLLVRYGNREGVVGPGRKGSEVWRGLPVGGAWEFVSALEKGEIPGSKRRPPPDKLSLRVGVQCAGGAGGAP